MPWKDVFSMSLLPNHLHQYPLGPLAIELAVEDLLPRAEVQFAIRDGHNDFPAHDLTFHVGVGVVFSGSVVGITLGGGIKRGELLQPFFVVLVQARLIVVNKNPGGDVHGVAHPPLGYS